MWNYSYVLPSFLVLLVLLAHYFLAPRLNIRINRTFLALIGIDVLTLLTDLAATRADEVYTSFSVEWLYIFNTAFFACYLARAFAFFLFALDLLRTNGAALPHSPVRYGWMLALSELIVISSCFTGAVFRIDHVSGYQRGPFYAVLYICFLFYIFYGFYLLDRNAAKLDRSAYAGALAYHVVLLAGNAVRYLLPRYLVMNTFCLLAIMIIYLAFENPDLYLANRRIAFSMRAFRAEMEERVGRRPYRVLAFVIQDYADTREIYGGIQMDRGVDMIAAFITSGYPDYQAFYLRNGCFALLGDESMPWEQMRSSISKRFLEPWRSVDAELYLEVAFVQLGSEAQIASAEQAVNTIVGALGYAATASDNLINLNENRTLDQQMEVKSALERALDEDKLEVFLQPIMDSASGAVAGAEVLARIRDGDGRIIPPSLFIPVAEKNGKINLVGERVLEKTCRFLHEYGTALPGLKWVNVNLSPIQCMKRDLSERFLEILSENGISSELFRFELAGQSVIDIPLLEEHIQTLHEKGFTFSLGDYGRSYTNLNRVTHYPFVNIKLDTEAVLDYFHDQDQMLPSIVPAFKRMGYTVTAEGIESKEMADAMTAIGCDYLQGFYYSKPLPVGEFVEKYGGEPPRADKT